MELQFGLQSIDGLPRWSCSVYDDDDEISIQNFYRWNCNLARKILIDFKDPDCSCSLSDEDNDISIEVSHRWNYNLACKVLMDFQDPDGHAPYMIMMMMISPSKLSPDGTAIWLAKYRWKSRNHLPSRWSHNTHLKPFPFAETI